MQLMGIYSDGCEQDITYDPATVWDSENTNVFTIGNKTGIVTGIQQGSAQAAVKYRSNTATATVTVVRE